MSKSTATIILVIIIIFTLPIFFIVIPILFMMYNSLTKKKNQVDMSFSGIDVMLKKRSDLIPNLVNSVKQIMKHEKEVFTKITELRSKILDNQDDVEKRFEMENTMSQLLGAINVSMENYPEIKSDQNMAQLQRSLTEIEEQLSASRRAYNSSVLTLNNSITTIPSNIMAGFMSLKERVYFQATEAERATPNVGKLFD